MTIVRIVTVLALTIGMVAVAAAWESPSASRQPILPQMAQAQASQPSPTEQPTAQGWPATLPARQPYAGPDYQSPMQPGLPQYPYPQHHNPFFEGMPRNFFSGAMDWLLSLPQTLLDRASNYVDGTFFPQAPATHGQAPQSGNATDARAEDAARREPLPPAQRYVPQQR